jgi:UDP-N-acetyl-2-amino-2-deoxyglucuronate dehydrogenase
VVVCGFGLLDGKKCSSLIRFAIVGCGTIAQKHAALCNQFGKLAAVCDIALPRATELGKKYAAKAYQSLSELIENEDDLTALVICTPNGLHAEQTISGLNKGLHVICEKPMAILVADAMKMNTAAEKSGKELFIIKQNRFNPAVIKTRDLLQSDGLGKIYSIQLNAFWHRGPEYYADSWHGDKKLDGGILFTQFSHFIDLMYWLFGDVKRVLAYERNFHREYDKEIEDTLVACFEMDHGVLGTGHFSVNSFNTNMEGSLTILAQKGTLKIGGRYLNEISYQAMDADKIVLVHEENKENDYGTYKGSMSNHDKVYEHIRDVLTTGCQNNFSGRDGLKTVEIINRIYQAANDTGNKKN